MKRIFIFCAIFCGYLLYSQIDSTFVDRKYREDQFYISMVYNALIGKPDDVSQYNLSRGYGIGFLRDFPINERRNVALATGLGYSYNLVYTNIETKESGGGYRYEKMQMSGVDKNYYRYHYLRLTPIEFRWRGSNDYNKHFWRFHTGVNVDVLLSSTYKKEYDGGEVKINGSGFHKDVDVKCYISVGKGTWNVFAQYGFFPLFYGQRDEKGNDLSMKVVNLGLIFYIL